MVQRKNNIRLITIFIAIILTFSWITLLNATSFKLLTLEDICRESSEIIIARVEAMNSYSNEDKTRLKSRKI